MKNNGSETTAYFSKFRLLSLGLIKSLINKQYNID